MEIFFLILLVAIMAFALGSGYPVAFALPGSAILTIGLAAVSGYLVTGDSGAYFHSDGPYQWLSSGVTNLRGVYWEADRDTLIAIPLFIFMGIMLQRSKIAEDLLVTMAQLFGPIPGGLGISVVFVGALLAATTGIVGATVVAMGLISLPAMLRNNYSRPLATGTIAASGTLGQIIPPSIVLIILADQLASAVDQASTARKTLYRDSTGELTMPSSFDVISTSAGDMFLGAFVPGLVLVGLYMAYILTFALLRPTAAPAVPYEGAYDGKFAVKVFRSSIPPLLLIFLVLGSIIAGIATVNQAGAIGAVGALIMAGYRLREGERGAFSPAILAAIGLVALGVVLSFYDTNIQKDIESTEQALGLILAALAVGMVLIAVFWSGWRTLQIEDTLKSVMLETAKTTSLVFIILLGAAMLTSAFRAFGGEDLVKEFLEGLPGGFWGKFVTVMLVIFVLGFFLDFIEIAVVVVPIVAPILLADPTANVTAVWLGVMIGLNIQTSFLTPPFGFALFYLRGVAPPIVKTVEMYRGVIPYISLQLLALVIVGLYPALVNYLPNRVALTAETAPPPRNPTLQYCLEDYMHGRFADEGDRLRGAIASVRALGVEGVPRKLAGDLTESYDKADAAFGLLDGAISAQAAVRAAAAPYRPIHQRMRDIERDIRVIEEKIKEEQTTLSRGRGRGDLSATAEAAIEARIAEHEAEIAALEAAKPAEWDDVRPGFAELVKNEQTLRQQYRRTVDAAYEPIPEMIEIIRDGPKLDPIAEAIAALPAKIAAASDPKAASEDVKAVMDAAKRVAGADEVEKRLSRARRELRKRNPKIEKALEEIAKAAEETAGEQAWRADAATRLLPGLEAYEAEIRDTIGLRAQSRLHRTAALDIAACSADHRDIALSF